MACTKGLRKYSKGLRKYSKHVGSYAFRGTLINKPEQLCNMKGGTLKRNI